MWQFQQGDRRHPRRLPRARHAGRQRQRQLLQRDRGPQHPADADDRAWSACSTTSSAHLTPWCEGARATSIVLLGRTREELGGSEYLAVRPRPGARRAAVDRPRGREAPAPRSCLAAAQERLAALGARRRRGRPRGGARRVLASAARGARRARRRSSGGIRADALLFGESQSRMLVVACAASTSAAAARARAPRRTCRSRCSARCAAGSLVDRRPGRRLPIEPRASAGGARSSGALAVG